MSKRPREHPQRPAKGDGEDKNHVFVFRLPSPFGSVVRRPPSIFRGFGRCGCSSRCPVWCAGMVESTCRINRSGKGSFSFKAAFRSRHKEPPLPQKKQRVRGGLFGSIRRPVKPNANQKTTTSRTLFLVFYWKRRFSEMPPCNSTKKIFLFALRENAVKMHKKTLQKQEKTPFSGVFLVFFGGVFVHYSHIKKDAF